MLLIILAIAMPAILITGLGYFFPKANGFWILIAGCIGLALPVALGEYMVSGSVKTTEVVNSTELHALVDGSRIGGSFFLGIGSIGERPVYTGYIKSGDGFKLKQFHASRWTIKHDSDRPRAEVTKEKTDHFLCSGWIMSCDGPEPMERVLYVPEGSIENNFVLDAE